MKEKIQSIRDDAFKCLENMNSLKDIEELRVKLLGKKGELTSLLKGMGKLSPDERPVIGALVNRVREEIEDKIHNTRIAIEKRETDMKLQDEALDVTLETTALSYGHRHPLLQTLEELENLFVSMGFTVIDGPEIETVKNNFDDLNCPSNHPSRDQSDTFYIDDNRLLRTQTSPVQIRAMRDLGAPLKIISAGRTFRNDEVDDTHSPMFHQLEGLVIDKGVTMGNLISTLDVFIKTLFGEDFKTRYRPHYFPFTEPSAEVDVTCYKCHGKGCPSCNNTGWSMELLGCGMVDPQVLLNCGIDPEVYSGFAFGMGIDRIAMVKYGISDIRLLFENDQRFLEQF